MNESEDPMMKLPVVEYATPDKLEGAIADMLERLKGEIALAVKGGHEDRAMQLLAQLMPPFIRALESERATFVSQVRAAAKQHTKTLSFMDEHLMVMMLPVVNMIGCVIVTLVPETPTVTAEDRDRVRQKMFAHIVDNIIAGVTGYVVGAGGSALTVDGKKEGKRDDTRLHS